GDTVMANTNSPYGFRQYQGTGSAPTYEQVSVLIAAADTTKVYFGDPVVPLNTGYVAQASSNSVQIAGIFVGCKYLSVSQKRTVWSNYWPGADNNGDVTAYIVNDPNAKFIAQTDATGAVQGDVNANVGFAIGTGNQANGISGAYVDMSTVNTTATLPFRIVSLVTQPPGAPGTEAGAYNTVIVAFNNVSTKQLLSVG
ncbi:MAG: hypothetical protein ACR2IJ_05705, partial [Fluviibacter sp.]